MSHIFLSEINIYPIKSCKGTSLQTCQLDDRGLQFDRRWMVVDGGYRFMTQREVPRLSLISVGLRSDRLALGAPNMEQLDVPIGDASNQDVQVVVWDDTVAAVDCGDGAARWLCEFLGIESRLVYMPDNADRIAERGGYASQVSFADSYPLLLISESSLSDLNSRLDEPLPMNRFRPNLVVRGCGPYAEDTWKDIEVGGVTIHVVKPCSRCATTTVNQSTGERGKEPLLTLATYRQHDGRVFFGQNLIHDGPGTLKVGEEVRVIQRG